jgi:thiol-disulfide isomerase/thioredoxin
MEWMSSWKTIAISIAVSSLFLGIAYYFYSQHSKSKSLFDANKESGTSGSDSPNKTATLMLFYADWCPHCKTAKPEWEDAKAAFDGTTINGYKVTFVEYNCTNENAKVAEVIGKYDIDGFPTIKLLKDGEIVSYEANVTKEILDEFLHQIL